MCDSLLKHATVVDINGNGVLFCGKSGSGKSDLALRLVMNKNAKLVTDDVVCLQKNNGEVYGSAPQNIAGKFEVRGVGIVDFPYVQKTKIKLWVQLVDDVAQIERMPKEQAEVIFGVAIKKIDLYAKECSAPDKLMLALEYMENNA